MEALCIPDQRLLQVLKAFENALESQLKYNTGNRAWNNFCVCLDQWCSRERNLRGRDLKFGDRDSARQNLSILPRFDLNVVITSELIFFYFWHFPRCFSCFLLANSNKQKSVEFYTIY